MSRLLRYLCNKIFTGEADQIKEYSIAVDLLGRPPSFDPSEDAIARVEVHRLRKKLREYYEAEGFDHKLRVVIPAGSYIPTFVLGETSPAEVRRPSLSAAFAGSVQVEPRVAADAGVASAVALEAAASAAPAGPAPVNRRWLMAAGALLLLVGGIGAALRFVPRSSPSAAVTPPAETVPDKSKAVPPAPQPIASEDDSLRLAVGRSTGFRDSNGRSWGAERFFTGGEIVQFPGQFVDGTLDQDLFHAARTGNFQYNIPLGSGTWELRLYFAEMQFGPGFARGGGEGSRVFHVVANEKRILSDFDVISDAAGPRIADVRVFKDIVPNSEGRLRLSFIGSSGQAMVSAIELVPAMPHRISPIRLSVRDSSYKDSSGQLWMRDAYWHGGRTNDHATPIHDSPDPDLYARERYGHFSYAIPVSDGVYDVSIYFAETYWGPENPGGGGPGSRVFDVFCNGLILARNLDVYSRIGANRGYVMRFKGLHPNPQGKLALSFVPVKNYASVYAISVDDVSP